MADEMKSIVDKAIEESVNAFVRGVKFHDLTDPKTTIPDEIIDWLKTHKDVKTQFRTRLKSNPETQWKEDREQVCKAAFDAGALAAFYALSQKVTEVSTEHVKSALEHIGTICKVSFGARYIYCPWLPGPKKAGDDS